MDRFHTGMRRLAIVAWVIGCLFAFFAALENGVTPSALGYAVGGIAGWSGVWWVFVFVVRWVWLGFADKHTPTS